MYFSIYRRLYMTIRSIDLLSEGLYRSIDWYQMDYIIQCDFLGWNKYSCEDLLSLFLFFSHPLSLYTCVIVCLLSSLQSLGSPGSSHPTSKLRQTGRPLRLLH